ncbi:MAG TPA: hypothetical protein VK577_03705 [Bradyrhizobium sp.]|nr:hypothetical protein [Bradyrhizobium sp.]
MNESLLPDDAARVQMVADAINEAIPDGTPSGYVMSALCLLLQIGLNRAQPDVREKSRQTIVAMFGGNDRSLQ